jgi:glycosyltransferase involved in cell wall biosynthesis
VYETLAPVRVAMVVPDLDPTSGGPAENVPRLAAALAGSGVEVELHAVGPVPAGGAAGLTMIGHEPAWPRRLGRSPALRRALLDSAADVVHAHCLWMSPLGYAAESARRRAVPLVVSPRGMLTPWARRRSPLKKALARQLVHPGAFEQAAGWHATSETEASQLRAYGLVQPICVAPNGIEPPAEDAEASRRFYLDAAPALRNRRVLLFYSRFHSKKRVLELMRDFKMLAPRLPEWHLLVVGIPEEYSLERLRDEAVRMGLDGRASVLDGRGAPKPYPVAELFVLPTHDENFGRVVAEALASGVPAVTTTGTPWGELDGVGAGTCVSIDALPRELERWMSKTADERRAAGARGREWALQALDWTRIAARLRDFYAQLLAARARGPR